MSKEELKPCLCGAAARWCGDGNDDPADNHECHQIHCDSCGIQFDVENAESKDAESTEDLRAITAKAWNTRAPQSEWISVDDRMPPVEDKGENSDPDMVYTHTSDVIALLSSGDTVRTYHDGDVWCYHDLSGCPQYDVTHWMPLPSPPKGV